MSVLISKSRLFIVGKQIKLLPKEILSERKKKYMKKMMMNLAGIMLLVGFMSFSAISAQAKNLWSYGSNNVIKTNVLPTPEAQDFDLVNKTGWEIVAVYVSKNNDELWGRDILEVDTLSTGETATITFDPSESVYWDLRVDEADGTTHELVKVNLKKIETIELYYKNGEVTSILYQKRRS